MSELKEIGIRWEEDGELHFSHVYLKSEADKVIEELKDKCQMHDFFWEGCGFAKRGFKNSISVSEAFDKLEAEVRHHKFKRCLAMARWCEAEVHRSLTEQSALIDFPEIDRFQYLQWHFTHFSRWHKRWLELAEKFKEAK